MRIKPNAVENSRWRRGLANLVAPLGVVALLAAALTASTPFQGRTTPTATTLRQVHYLPWTADQFLEIAEAQRGATFGATSIHLVSSVVSALDGNTVAIDHWEDGYDADPILSPAASTETFSMDEGDFQVLESDADVDPTGSTIDYDGRDKIVSTGAVVVTAGGWPEPPGSVHAGAVAVPSVSRYGYDFVSPVGEDTPFNSTGTSPWEYTGLLVLASADNTAVQVTGEADSVMDEGETLLVHDINLGDTVSADKPVAVFLATGDVGAEWEGRVYDLAPTERWHDSYVTPVGSRNDTTQQTRVFMYNPGASAIDVAFTESDGETGTITIGAGAQGNHLMDIDEGARFSSPGNPFYAIQAITTPEGANDVSRDYNWGLSLIPEDWLTPMIVVGYGPGSSDFSANYNAVWVAADADTTIYVDLDADPTTGPNTDGDGNKYDFSCAADALTPVLVKDTVTGTCSTITGFASAKGSGDADMTGARIYTDGANLASAWGQVPGLQASNPAIDMGTTVLPFPVIDLTKDAEIVDDDGDGLVDPGETIRYTITAANRGIAPVDALIMLDNVPEHTSYVEDTTTVDDSPLADADTGTPFLFDEGGTQLPPALDVGQTRIVTFDVVADDPLANGVTEIVNQVVLNTDYGTYTDIEITPTSPPEGTIGDFVWLDLNGDGLQDPGEPGIEGVTVNLYAGSGTGGSPVDTTTTAADGTYSFTVEPGDYTVEVVPQSGWAFGPAGIGGDPGDDSDVDSNGVTSTITVNDRENRTDAGDAAVVIAAIGDHVWRDLDWDGIQDPGEPGIEGVTVNLYLDAVVLGVPIASTTTSASGDYLFPVLPGSYRAEVVEPAGGGFTTADQGPEGTDSDVNGSGRTNTIVAISGNSYTEMADAGVLPDPEPAVSIVKSVNGVDTTVAADLLVPAGDPVTFTYTVTNTGNEPLTGVVVTDDQGVNVSCPQSDLGVGESMDCTGSDTAVEGPYTNTGTVEGDGIQSDETVTDSDDAGYTGVSPGLSIVKRVNGQDANSAPGVALPAGDPVQWTFTVTNTGTETVAGIAVDDPLLGSVSCPETSLGAGESMDCTPIDDTAEVGQVTNVATVTGTGTVSDDPVGDSDAANYFGQDPRVSILHEVFDPFATAWFDADADGTTLGSNDGRPAVIPAGTTASLRFTVNNDGNIDLSNVIVTDPRCDSAPTLSAGDAGTPGVLDVGESWVLSCSVANVIGGFTSTATVTAESVAGAPAGSGSTEAADVVVPGITVSKQVRDPATGQWVETATIDEGEPVTFRIVVTNSGEVRVGNITVDDPETPDCDRSFTDVLEPGESFTAYTCVLPAVTADFTNTVTVTGTPVDPHDDPVGDPVEHSDPAQVVMDPLPTEVDLSLDKEMTGYDPETGIARWVFTVTNHGPAVAQPNIVVTDDLPEGLDYVKAEGEGWDCSFESGVVRCVRDTALAVGASASFTLDTVVTRTGEDIVNTAAVGGPDVETDLENNTDDAGVTVDADEPGDEPPPLARTGADVAKALALALGLIGAGVAATLAARRRRTASI